MIAAVGGMTLLLAGVGASPLAASQQPATDDMGVVVSAEDDPAPTPKPKPTPWPTPPGVKGLDVSHWNGYPNFTKMRAKGMRFVFSKVTQGTNFVDDTYQRHTRDAREAGILAGAYHFFDYRKGGAAQARHFLDTLRSTSGLGSLLPLVVDVETLSTLGTPRKTLARQRLHALLDELYRQTGRYPMIYTSRHMWTKVVGAPGSFGQYPLWVACWKCNEVHLPNGWSDWDFWQVGQFKFTGGPKLDGNVYRRNMDRLRSDREGGMRIDGGSAWTPQRAVKADVRRFDGSHVRVAVGGEGFGPWQPFEPRVDMKLSSKQGNQDVRVQLRSFRGVKTVTLRDDIKLDSVPPAIAGLTISMRRGTRVQQSGARIPTLAAMSARDATSGLDRVAIQATCGGAKRASKFSAAGSLNLNIHLDRHGCEVKAHADDAVGHRKTRRLDPSVSLIDLHHGGANVTFSGAWKTLRNGDALGKNLVRAKSAGAQARVRFDGAQVAVVARRGPAGGRFKVILDGKVVDTIDLYSPKGDSRRIVWVRSVPRGKHVLKLRATGTSSGKSSGAGIVWLDAVLALDRRK